jgi:hypothetical protein
MKHNELLLRLRTSTRTLNLHGECAYGLSQQQCSLVKTYNLTGFSSQEVKERLRNGLKSLKESAVFVLDSVVKRRYDTEFYSKMSHIYDDPSVSLEIFKEGKKFEKSMSNLLGSINMLDHSLEYIVKSSELTPFLGKFGYSTPNVDPFEIPPGSNLLYITNPTLYRNFYFVVNNGRAIRTLFDDISVSFQVLVETESAKLYKNVLLMSTVPCLVILIIFLVLILPSLNLYIKWQFESVLTILNIPVSIVEYWAKCLLRVIDEELKNNDSAISAELFILLQQLETGAEITSKLKGKSKSNQKEKTVEHKKFVKKWLLPKDKVIKQMVIILIVCLIPLITMCVLPQVIESSGVVSRIRGISNVAYQNEQAFLNLREAVLDIYSSQIPQCNTSCLSYLETSSKFLEGMWDTYKKVTYGDETLGIQGLLSGAENEGVLFESFFGNACSAMYKSINEEYNAHKYCEHFDNGLMKNGLSSSMSTYYSSIKTLISKLESSHIPQEIVSNELAYLEVLSLLICMVCDVVSEEAKKPLEGLLFMNNMVILPLEYIFSLGFLMIMYSMTYKYVLEMEKNANGIHSLLLSLYETLDSGHSQKDNLDPSQTKKSYGSIIRSSQFPNSEISSKTSKKVIDVESTTDDKKVIIFKTGEQITPDNVTSDEDSVSENHKTLEESEEEIDEPESTNKL